MIDQIYADLMSRLDTANRTIAAAREAFAQASKAADDAQRLVDDEKASEVITAGGYSSLGKNAEDREYKLIQLLNGNGLYQRALANLRKAEQVKTDAKRNLDNALTDFDIARTQTALTSSYMKYSAISAAKPAVADLLDL